MCPRIPRGEYAIPPTQRAPDNFAPLATSHRWMWRHRDTNIFWIFLGGRRNLEKLKETTLGTGELFTDGLLGPGLKLGPWSCELALWHLLKSNTHLCYKDYVQIIY